MRVRAKQAVLQMSNGGYKQQLQPVNDLGMQHFGHTTLLVRLAG